MLVLYLENKECFLVQKICFHDVLGPNDVYTLCRREHFTRGGGCLLYLSDRDVPFFKVSFSPIFSRIGYQKKALFWSRLLEHIKRGKFVRLGCYLVKFLYFWRMVYTEFF